MDGVECGQSLAPEWLSFSRELPSSSSQDKSPTKHSINDRDRPGRRIGKQHSYHHLTHISPAISHSHSHSLQSSSSSNWRHSDPNPRILNRSKSSPGFDSKENGEPSKSPERSTLANVIVERHFGPLHPRQKSKVKSKPPLISSRSQPNLFATDKSPWQQKFRSPPPSRAPSLLSNSTTVVTFAPNSPRSTSPSLPTSTPPPVTTVSSPVIAPTPSPIHVTPPITTPAPEDLDLEMEKFRTLVPSPSVASAVAPKPPTRLVSSRKTTHPKPPGRPEKPATPPPNAHLKKATSDPALLVNVETPKARVVKVDKAKFALKETFEEQGVSVAKRNNFLMDVFKKEKQIQDSCGEDVEHAVPDEASIPLSSAPGSESNTDTERTESSSDEAAEPENVSLAAAYQHGGVFVRKSTVEDEERFLRLLGWVPDEEDHVPELDEAEIAEVRMKINSHQQVLCK